MAKSKDRRSNTETVVGNERRGGVDRRSGVDRRKQQDVGADAPVRREDDWDKINDELSE